MATFKAFTIAHHKKEDGTNPHDLDEKKWYASAVTYHKITDEQLIEEVAESCTFARAELRAAVELLLEKATKHLMMGNSVKFGALGTIAPSIKGLGTESVEEWDPNMIRNIKYAFYPGSQLIDARKKAKVNVSQFHRIVTP